MQQDIGPSLENIPASDDIILGEKTFANRHRSKTKGEIREAVSFSSIVSKPVFIDNFLSSCKYDSTKVETQNVKSVTQFWRNVT